MLKIVFSRILKTFLHCLLASIVADEISKAILFSDLLYMSCPHLPCYPHKSIHHLLSRVLKSHKDLL